MFSIVSLLVGIGILLLGHGLINTVLTLRAAAEQYPDSLIGLIMAAYFAGYGVGTFYCPRLINRIGHIRTFAVVAALSAGVIIAHGFFVNPWAWLFGRLLFGGCVVSVYMVVESWLNSRTDNALRGRVFAIYTVVNLGALAAGQFLLLTGEVRTMDLFALAGALFSISLVPIALTKIPEPAPVALARIDLKQLYALSPLAAAASVLAGLAGSAFFALGPLFGSQIGLTENAVALFMAATIAGGALFQWPIGRWSDQTDRRRVLSATAIGAAIVAVAMLFVRDTALPLLLLLGAVYGGLAFTVYPLGVAMANDRTDRETHDDAIGISGSLLLAYGIGATGGPLLAGGLMQFTGPEALIGFFVACWTVLAGLTFVSLWSVAPVADADKEAFILTTRTSPIALEAQIETGIEEGIEEAGRA